MPKRARPTRTATISTFPLLDSVPRKAPRRRRKSRSSPDGRHQIIQSTRESMVRKETCDIIVIGGGSAAHEAAVAARQCGAERIIMLEKAPESRIRRECALFPHRLSFRLRRRPGNPAIHRCRRCEIRHLRDAALYARELPRRPQSRDRRPHRSGACDVPGRQLQCGRPLDARDRHSVSSTKSRCR